MTRALLIRLLGASRTPSPMVAGLRCGGVLAPLPVFFTVASLLASTAAVSADPIRIINDLRSTVAAANPHLGPSPDNQVASAPPSDAMRAAVTASSGGSSGSALAVLTSSYMDPTRWSGSGLADIDWTTQSEGRYNALSAFLVSFTVTSPVTYAFNGTLNATVGDSSSGNIFAILRNSASSPPFFFDSLVLVDPDTSVTLAQRSSGMLLPGHYFLNVGGYVEGTVGPSVAATSASHALFVFAIDFAPAPTPEPASLVLLGTGFFGLVGRTLRKRRGSSGPS
jgi:hypothetical protein